MSRVPFFTGDSTTWLVGTQYGELNWFTGRKLKRLKKKDWKRGYRQKYINLGGNPKLMDEENPYELIRINLLVFKQAEKFIRQRIRGKSYWLKGATDSAKVSPSLGRRKSSSEGKEEKEVTKKKPVVKKKKKPVIKKKSEPKKEEEPKKDLMSKLSDEPTQEYSAPKRKNFDKGVQENNTGMTKFEQFQSMSEDSGGEQETLEEKEFPPLEWFDTEAEDYKGYLKQLHVDTEIPKDEALDIIYDFSIFLKYPEELENIPTPDLTSLSSQLVGMTTESREEAIEALQKYYKDNAIGKRNDFEGSGMGFDEAPERAQERESYLHDDEYELVDVSEDEMNTMLPEPIQQGDDMPEVTEMDKELQQKGYFAVRDEKGRFLKGQKQVRKPKKLYSDKFPELACDTCYKAGECPEYKPGHVCAFKDIFKKFDSRKIEDVVDAMGGMVNVNMERMMRLAMFEKMDGGMADPALTSMIDQNMKLMKEMKDLHEQKDRIVASQYRTMRADGTTEETTSVTNPSEGILAKLFGSANGEEEEDEVESDPNVIDAKE